MSESLVCGSKQPQMHPSLVGMSEYELSVTTLAVMGTVSTMCCHEVRCHNWVLKQNV